MNSLAQTETFYRDYIITFNPKAVPSKDFDYDFVHKDYDPTPTDYEGPSTDGRCGNGKERV
jgi:hypothetical protein